MRQRAISAGTEVSQFRTLIVEDHEAFLQFVDSTLRQLQDVCIVDKARTRLDAVKLAEALQPDLILLDIGLPGLNGIDAAYRIRKLAPDARIIFVTQEGSAEIVREAFSLGAWGYVIKSLSAQDLPAAVDAVLRGKTFVSNGLDGHAQLSET